MRAAASKTLDDLGSIIKGPWRCFSPCALVADLYFLVGVLNTIVNDVQRVNGIAVDLEHSKLGF